MRCLDFHTDLQKSRGSISGFFREVLFFIPRRDTVSGKKQRGWQEPRFFILMVIHKIKTADFKHDSVWATQEQIAGIFEVKRSVATKHIRNILIDKGVCPLIITNIKTAARRRRAAGERNVLNDPTWPGQPSVYGSVCTIVV